MITIMIVNMKMIVIIIKVIRIRIVLLIRSTMIMNILMMTMMILYYHSFVDIIIGVQFPVSLSALLCYPCSIIISIITIVIAILYLL